MSIHQVPRGGGVHAAAPMHEHLGLHRDARNTLDARRRGRSDEREEAGYGYHPRHDRRYDNSEDQSLSPNLPGPPAFG